MTRDSIKPQTIQILSLIIFYICDNFPVLQAIFVCCLHCWIFVCVFACLFFFFARFWTFFVCSFCLLILQLQSFVCAIILAFCNSENDRSSYKTKRYSNFLPCLRVIQDKLDWEYSECCYYAHFWPCIDPSPTQLH